MIHVLSVNQGLVYEVLEGRSPLFPRQTHLASRSSIQTADKCDRPSRFMVNAAIGSTKMFVPATLESLSPVTTDPAP
jgi:hypothetical protein